MEQNQAFESENFEQEPRVNENHWVGFKDGAIAGFPIVAGYFPVAMAFGLLSKNAGVSFIDCCLFSIMVFAGASQFMALDLIKAGISMGNIILAAFLLNLRHLMMSASLSVKLRAIKKHWLIFIAFGVTDETFSVTSLSNKKLTVPFLISLHSTSYLSWVFGSAAGYIVGEILPKTVQNSLSVGLYAMFAGLLVPEIKKSSPVLFLSIISGFLYAVLSYTKLLSASWNLIIAIIVSAVVGTIFIKDEVQKEGE
ncbi:MAG: AzlC family ABC transporter permease [Bacillota bacterium]|nr:AzlC family ABC transporter permease [Bacillota bacterium]